MIPVLIIGYGNPLRTDDGIGWQAARALLSEWPNSRVRVEPSHQLLPEMADWIADADYVIFIDACWNLIPGRIRTRPIHLEEIKTVSLTHTFSPEGLLGDAWHLFHHCPDAIMVSVGGSSFDHGEGLSKNMDAAFPSLLGHVKRLVHKRFETASAPRVAAHA